MNVKKLNSDQLLERYEKDILYDAHQTETKIQRSRAKQEIHDRGTTMFSSIAKRMKITFSSNSLKEFYEELLMAYARLISGMIDYYQLPKGPYASTVKYRDQNPEAWIAYCESQSKSK